MAIITLTVPFQQSFTALLYWTVYGDWYIINCMFQHVQAIFRLLLNTIFLQLAFWYYYNVIKKVTSRNSNINFVKTFLVLAWLVKGIAVAQFLSCEIFYKISCPNIFLLIWSILSQIQEVSKLCSKGIVKVIIIR